MVTNVVFIINALYEGQGFSNYDLAQLMESVVLFNNANQ